jgi:hypothetical protein
MKQTTGAKRGRPANATKGPAPKRKSTPKAASSVDPFASSEAESVNQDDDDDVEVLGSEAETPKKRRTPAAKGKGKSKARTPSRRDEDASDEEMDVDANTSAARRGSRGRPETVDDDDEPPEKTIPPGLVSRLLQDMFEKEGTRMTGDAARVTAKYIDVFVREAVARCMHEKTGTFLEVSGEVSWERR